MNRIPFDKDSELKVIGEYKALIPGAPGTPKRNTPISSKENLNLLLTGQKPLWMPASSECFTFIPKIIPDNIARGFVFDADPLDLKDAGGEDMFGVHWDYIPKVGGSMVRPGAPKVPDINRWEDYITFPDLETLDWVGSAQRNKELLNTGRTNIVWVMNGLFERLISFVDFENAALAMIDEDQQDSVHRLFSALCDFYDKLIEKFKVYYNADILLFHDDWGSQRAPFFSLKTVREMLVPYLSRIADSCHRRGMYLELHSCGKNEMLVPAMIEAGVDIWSPQTMNDRHLILKQYGDKIIIGVAPDMLPPEATEEDAIRAAESFMNEYVMYDNVIAGIMRSVGASEKMLETIYTRSRQAYNA